MVSAISLPVGCKVNTILIMETVTNTNEIITDKDFFEYPTIEAFKTKLEELRNIDFTNTDKKTIGETIFSYLTVVPSLIGKYSPEKFNQFKFYKIVFLILFSL